MTNPLITKIQEADELFDGRFSLEFFSTEDWQYDYRETPSEIEFKTWQENATNGARTKKDMIKSFHRSTITSLLQAEIERMKGMKSTTTEEEISIITDPKAKLIQFVNMGFNAALDEQIDYYQECVKFLKPNE